MSRDSVCSSFAASFRISRHQVLRSVFSEDNFLKQLNRDEQRLPPTLVCMCREEREEASPFPPSPSCPQPPHTQGLELRSSSCRIMTVICLGGGCWGGARRFSASFPRRGRKEHITIWQDLFIQALKPSQRPGNIKAQKRGALWFSEPPGFCPAVDVFDQDDSLLYISPVSCPFSPPQEMVSFRKSCLLNDTVDTCPQMTARSSQSTELR